MTRTLADMTPEDARDYLDRAGILGIAHHEQNALEALANMKIETQYHRNYDTGRYERHTRTVGEWVKNDD